jgi:hypothetical protein
VRRRVSLEGTYLDLNNWLRTKIVHILEELESRSQNKQRKEAASRDFSRINTRLQPKTRFNSGFVKILIAREEERSKYRRVRR